MYKFGAIVFSASNFEQDFLLENFRFSMMNICLKFNATFPKMMTISTFSYSLFIL